MEADIAFQNSRKNLKGSCLIQWKNNLANALMMLDAADNITREDSSFPEGRNWPKDYMDIFKSYDGAVKELKVNNEIPEIQNVETNNGFASVVSRRPSVERRESISKAGEQLTKDNGGRNLG